MNSPKNNLTPSGLSRDGDRAIVITWNDGTSTSWTVGELRKICPCATCREKKRGEEGKAAATTKRQMPGLPVLSAAEARPLTIEAMNPVGTYAYNIVFSDGHNSGIFTFDLLRKTPS